MAEIARKADQERRCNGNWLYCTKCSILVMKGQLCSEYGCRKSFDKNTAEWKVIFAEEDKVAAQQKIDYDARQASLAASAGSSSSGGGHTLTGNAAIDKAWTGHLSYVVVAESDYWETIKGKWGNDWEGDIIHKLDKIYASKKMTDEKLLPSVPDGNKSNMLNLFRNTIGAKEKFGERTGQEMLDNVLTLLNEAENAGIFAA